MGRSCWRYNFCRDKIRLLSWQTYFCCNKTFAATNICHDKHNFVVTKVCLSWQTYFCHDKTVVVTNICGHKQFYHDKSFVTTNLLLSRQKKSFVMMTKVCLLRQKFSFNKYMFVTTKTFCHGKHTFCCNKICHSKHTFVVIKDVFVRTKLLSGQKWYLWQLPPMAMTEVCNKGTKALTVH